MKWYRAQQRKLGTMDLAPNRWKWWTSGAIGLSSCPNANTVEEGYHYNGSGERAFGGAGQWPHLKLDINFRPGEEKQRHELAVLLMKTVSEYVDKLRKDEHGICQPEAYYDYKRADFCLDSETGQVVRIETKGSPTGDTVQQAAG